MTVNIALLLCVRFLKEQPAPDGERIAKGLFAFWIADWTTLQRSTPPNGTRWQMGFGVIRSPVGLVPETGEGSECMALMDRPAQAPRTWLREARREATRQGLALRRPSNIHQEAVMDTWEEFCERWRKAQEELAAMTEEQRVELVRAAFNSDEPEPF